jgi:hypothetical protein
VGDTPGIGFKFEYLGEFEFIFGIASGNEQGAGRIVLMDETGIKVA